MKENLNDLRAFLMVAQTGSFTKAGAQMGVSASALSHAIRAIEERLQIKLFHRTTRSISLTGAGEQLYAELSPLFEAVDASINHLGSFRNTLRGSLRINGNSHAFAHVLRDKLQAFIGAHPEVEMELVSELRFVDIVAERFDAGIRLDGDVAKDMVAVRISPPLYLRVVGSPDYFARHGVPQQPDDLATHACHSTRLPTSGGVLSWEFRHPESGAKILFAPQGRVLANSSEVLKNLALAGQGLVWLFDEIVRQELDSGELVSALDDWAIQAKRPCYVLAPQYDEIIADDDWRTSKYLETTIHLIQKLIREHKIDPKCLYATGQSGGCMTATAMNIKYPDFFAASYLVAGKWGADLVAPMAKNKVWWMASEDDTGAFPSFNAITERLQQQGVKISRAVWDGKWNADQYRFAYDDLIAERAQMYYTVFVKDSVFRPTDSRQGASGHRNTWRIAYSIEPIREWLFAQKKG